VGGHTFECARPLPFINYFCKKVSMKNLAQSIPARIRSAIYLVLGTVVAVETTLDAFDYGLVDAKPLAAFIAVATILGFGVAFGNVGSGDGEGA
jgi:hypothetical protein